MDRSGRVLERIKGPVVPLNICFNEDGSVDFGAVRRYVDWLCEQRVPIILLTYGSSEYSCLSDEDIWRLTAEVAEVNAGRSLFVTATGHWKPSQCRDFLAHADRVGTDAVKVQIHPDLPREREVYVGYFDRIEGASDIPLLLLDAAPPASLAAELAARPNIVGAKIHGFDNYYHVTRATRQEEFAVISAGQMRNMVFGHQIGSPAYLCTIAPFQPGIALEFYSHVDARHYDDARQTVFRYEEPWLAGAIEVGWLGAIKTAIWLRGLYPNNRPGPPKREVTPEQVDSVRRLIERLFGPIEKATLQSVASPASRR